METPARRGRQSALCLLLMLTLSTMILPGSAPAAPEAQRVVVIGDVAGSFESLVAVLRHAGLVGAELEWTGGSTTLVQTGDLLDGGTRVREVLDMMMRLRREAPASGGRVVALLGNHEAMNILGELRDVSYLTYETFAGEDAARLQDEAFRAHLRCLQARAAATGQPAPVLDDKLKADWLLTHPLGFEEYVASMAADGVYGRWLRTLPVAIRVTDMLLVHGGISPELDPADPDKLNRTLHDEITLLDRARTRLAEQGLVPEHAAVREMAAVLSSEIEYLNGLRPAERDRSRVQRAAELQDLTGWGSWLMIREDGPLWFRGATRWDETARMGEMAAQLDTLGVRRMITGQSSEDGQITARFNGRVVLVSTGMSDDPTEPRVPGYLEVLGDTLTAVTLEGRTTLIGAPAGAAAGGRSD